MSLLHDLGYNYTGLDLEELEKKAILGGLHSGVKTDYEDLANAILRTGRKGVTALSEKKDYFTEEQMTLRQQREVLNVNGVPDPSICRGLYRRAYNASAGTRPCRGFSEEW